MGDIIEVPVVQDYSFTALKNAGVAISTWINATAPFLSGYVGTIYSDVLIALYHISGDEYGYIGYCKNGNANFARSFTNSSNVSTITINSVVSTYVGKFSQPSTYYGNLTDLRYNFEPFLNLDTAREALSEYTPIVTYPITYSSSNSTVSGPSEAAVGDTVTVSAVPDVDYGITDQSTQISVTNNDVAVPFTWDATNQRIMFTMPDPS